MITELPVHDVPDWMPSGSALPKQLPIREILAGSVYYPACGIDGDPIKYLGGNFHSFVYVDYGVGRDNLKQNINGFRGYRLAMSRDVAEMELTPKGWAPKPTQRSEGTAQLHAARIQPPFAHWSIFERLPGFAPEHGPDRFSLIYIGGDGVATFQALYHGNKSVPAVVAIIQPGTGFGGNWTNFENENGPLARAVLKNQAGKPEYLLFGGWGVGEFYQDSCWASYSISVAELHPRLRLWKRKSTPGRSQMKPSSLAH